MVWRRRLLAVTAFLLCVYVYFAALHPTQTLEEHPFFDLGEARVIAHQGGRALWPENTLLAFREAWKMGVDVLEMDLRWTSGGELVVMHDGSVDRTTNGSGEVRSMSLAQIRELDAGYRFESADGFPYRGRGIKVPQLSEVLLAFPSARFNIEMKRFDEPLAEKLCSQLREYGASERTLVASFDHAAMVAFRKACPETATSATLREGLLYHYLGRLHLWSLYRSPAIAFQVPERLGDTEVITDTFLQRARAMHTRVQVWTVNEEADMRRLLAAGVDGILTDYPDRLLEVLGRDVPSSSAPLARKILADPSPEVGPDD